MEDIRKGIKERFFLALDTLSNNGIIRGVGTFAKMHGLNSGNLRNLRYKDSWSVSSEYLYYIIRDFRVNSQWLITGQGSMFSDQELMISALKKGAKLRAKSYKKCENTCFAYFFSLTTDASCAFVRQGA
jgi:hypothetical protein